MPISVPPPPGPSDRSANMRGNRRKDTGPELAVRHILHRAGFRYRVDHPVIDGKPRPVKPDIVFIRSRLAVFIDGCYWHGCPIHGQRPGGANSDYWGPKIARNQERDAEQIDRLEAAGWRVLRFWEHDDPESVARKVASSVSAGYSDAAKRSRNQ